MIVATPHRQRPQIATDRRSARAWCTPPGCSRCASFVAGSSVDGWSDTATIGTSATYVAPSIPRSRPGAGRNLQRAQLRSAGRGRAPVRRHRTRLDRARSGHQRGVAVLATFPSGKTTPWCGWRRSRMPPNRTRPRPASSTPGPSSRLLGFAPPTLHAMGIRIAGDVRGATAAAQPGAGDRCHVVVVSRRQRRPGSGERSRRAAERAARIAR